MVRAFLWVVMTIMVFNCSQKKDTGESVSINGIVISKYSKERMEEEAGKKFEDLTIKVWNEDFTKVDTIITGITIPFIKEDVARNIASTHLAALTKDGYYVFLKNLDFNEDFTGSFYDITIVKCNDQFEVVKIMQTCGPNYDVTNQMVIEKLKAWNEKSPFVIVVADGDRIEANFKTLPENLNAFADDIYEFCPDVIDQGAGSKEELITYIQAEKSFWLWWD